ncbi:hypothetical protein ACLBOM_11640 [Escherichia coli]
MAKNDFKAFATNRNANVISQARNGKRCPRLSGFTAGKASSAQVNKVIRQASFIAAALAQYVSDKRNGMCLIMVICPVLLNCWDRGLLLNT